MLVPVSLAVFRWGDVKVVFERPFKAAALGVADLKSDCVEGKVGFAEKTAGIAQPKAFDGVPEGFPCPAADKSAHRAD